jgi:magnesium transporter
MPLAKASSKSNLSKRPSCVSLPHMGKKKRSNKMLKRGLPPGTLVYTGHRAESPADVQTVAFSEQQYWEKNAFSLELHQKPNATAWTDVRGLNDVSIIERIGNEFNIHYLALEDVLDTQQRAKVEEYDNGLFFILPNLKLDPEQCILTNEQISVFCGANFVLSFQEDPDDTLAGVRKRIQEGLGRMRKKGTDYLTYSIIDNIVDNYYVALDGLEGRIYEVEEGLHLRSSGPTFKQDIFHLKQIINTFRHRLLPLREAVTRFYRTESHVVEHANRLYFRDVVDHVSQILDSLDNLRETLISLEAFYQAESANRLNNVMRLLTVISTIFIPLSFIAGVYGMNFDNMPELHWHYGYYIVLAFMFLSMIGMLFYFKIKKWI